MIITTENISYAVRDTRKALGLSQSELAKKASCSQRLISELEGGNTGASFAKVLSIFQALNIQLDAFSANKYGKKDVDEFLKKFEHDLSNKERDPRNTSQAKKRTKKLKDFL